MSSIRDDESSTDRQISDRNNETDPAAETTTPECDDCGGYVTRDYHRVFSDNDGELHGCLDCEGHGVPRGGNR